jgi:hypothetical protein
MRFGKALCAWTVALAALCCVRPAVAADLIYVEQQPQAAQLFDSAKAKIQIWTLARYFESEKIDTFCSIASAAMVLNALGVPAPVSRLTYPYNIFEQDNFFTTAVLAIQPVHSVAGKGVTLDQLATMVKTFGVTVDVYHADKQSVAQFRELVASALESRDYYIIVNFARESLGQIGGGHYSPLAAYNRKADRFLLMDVARYKYAPAWVQAEDLWNAMNTDDTDAKAKRGFVVIGRTKQ